MGDLSVNDGLTPRERRAFLEPGNRRVYLIATRSACVDSLSGRVRRLAEAGVGAVQLREKDATDREFVSLAEELREALRNQRVPLIVNDRVGLVAASRASGVHLGAEDETVFRARQLLGRDAIIGATAHSLEEAIGAERAGADYLGVGPVFESRTKRVSAPRGAEWLSTIVHAVKIPCLAIGGVNVENIETLARTGVHGVAVCEALMSSGDARTIAQAMQAALDRHRSLR